MMSPGTNAQDIVYHGGPWDSFPIASALRDLDLDYTSERDVDELLVLLRSQSWDLVIVRGFAVYDPDEITSLVPELEAHVDHGGALMFSHARIDLMPEFWPMLGIVDASNIFLPLAEIISSSNGSPFPVPPHPAFSTHARWPVGDELFGPDFGDALTPSSQSYSIAQYERDGPAAIVIGRAGRVITNGQQWDNWVGMRGIDLAADQLRWLLQCPADLDGDGDLTIFDFLEFQSLFDAGDPRADVFFDGRLDVFDFLEFLNLFEAGC